MPKKNTTTTEITAKSLETLMSENTNVSLAKLAEAVEAPYAAIRAKAKQPTEGVAYDPNSTNWSAIEAYILKRNPELKLEELPWADMNTKTERATKVLKDSAVDFSVGKSYYLRYFKQVWQIVYATETHVCLMVADGSSTQPKVMSKSTFVACGVKPADFQPKDVEESKEA